MFPAVEYVEHGHRQGGGIGAAQMAIEGELEELGGGMSCGQGDAEYGIGAQPRLVLCAVELNHLLIDAGLIRDGDADHGGPDFLVDVLHGLEHSQAAVSLLVPIA